MRTLTAVYQSNIGGHQHLRARSERINAARLFIILTSYTQVYEDSGVFSFKQCLAFFVNTCSTVGNIHPKLKMLLIRYAVNY